MGFVQCEQCGNAFKGKKPVKTVAAVIFQCVPGNPYQNQADENKKKAIHKRLRTGQGRVTISG